MIGYSFIYIHLTILETQFIMYKINVNGILNKINTKFDIFENNDLQDFNLMNDKLDKITL
tara:strand:+ start:101 stop:280 length:180 start_codon:yes stop_codon:yes gene_type:complete